MHKKEPSPLPGFFPKKAKALFYLLI